MALAKFNATKTTHKETLFISKFQSVRHQQWRTLCGFCSVYQPSP
jgi:hypothetical protein